MKIQIETSKANSRIPTGFCPKAQGCEERATLGVGFRTSTTLKGLRPIYQIARSHLRVVAALVCIFQSPVVSPAFAQNSVLYVNNFEKEQIGKVPEDFLVLDGGFTVKEEAGNKCLELPGSPLDSYSVQFGPAESSNIVVSARINSTAKGRRFPTFGVGLNGIAGYRLQLSPAKKLLELYKGDAAKTNAPFDWSSGHWLNFRLQIRGTNPGEWKIEGKVWSAENPEPSNWLISFDEKETPPSGRPSVFGSPFAGTPIQFDDLRVERVGTK